MLLGLNSPPVAVAIVWLAIASVAHAQQPPEAGPIVAPSNPCLVANGLGQPCPVPTVRQTGDKATLVAARLARAQFYIETSDLRQALKETDAALAIDPNSAWGHHLAARLAISLGDLPRASHEIVVALQLSPNDVNIQATNAMRFEAAQTPELALRAFNAILAQHPDHAYSREQRAKLLLSMQRPKDAVADLDKLLGADNPDTELLPLRASAYLQIDEPERAIADYDAALTLHPQQLRPLMGRAIAYMRAGHNDAALADLDAILGPIGGEPRYAVGGYQLVQYRMQRAFVLVRLKRLSDAAAEMVNAVDEGGRSAVLRAQVFLRQNGFPQTPLDGRNSDALRTALQACFGLESCFAKISDEL